MRRSTWTMAGALVVVLGMGISMAMAQNIPGLSKKGPALPNCPVMGEPLDFTISTKTDAGPVFFCCAGCVKKFNKDAGKYAEKVAVQRKALKDRAKVQVACPVSGEAVDGKTTLKHDGQTVGFCCPKCKGKFQADPANYASGLANSYTYQTKCPVMNGKIDPTSFSVLPTGQKIYYCCDGCGGKLVKSPAKYAASLASQGVNIDVKAILAAGKKKAHDHGGDHSGHGHD